MPDRKPFALFNSDSNFSISASTSIFSSEIGTKYSLDFTLKETPSTFSKTSSMADVLVNFRIKELN